ncbi:hypothetical protein E4U55_008159 [Claviceps digitariae]|nr:hypothetical protein E4U55_008159 [Claviceps digitariae]
MKFAVVLSLITGTLITGTSAAGHHNCGCTNVDKNGVRHYDKDLTEFACGLFKTLYFHDTKATFDGYSCTDYGLVRYIPGDYWEMSCKAAWGAGFGGSQEETRGLCWH